MKNNNTNQGWISIHRTFFDWEWWHDHNTSRLFLYLIGNANHKDNRWNGVVIKRGQIVTSRNKLAEATGLTARQVRTSLNKLHSTGEVASKTTNKYSLITINQYDIYQNNDKKSPATSHPSDQQAKNDDNIEPVSEIEEKVEKKGSKNDQQDVQQEVDDKHQLQSDTTSEEKQKVQQRVTRATSKRPQTITNNNVNKFNNTMATPVDENVDKSKGFQSITSLLKQIDVNTKEKKETKLKEYWQERALHFIDKLKIEGKDRRIVFKYFKENMQMMESICSYILESTTPIKNPIAYILYEWKRRRSK